MTAGKRVLILGGGYCGLAAAMELTKQGVLNVIAEKSGDVGGLSRVVKIGETPFELGPHIYFDKDREVSAYWRDLIGGELQQHLRRNRLYYQGKYIRSPLSLIDCYFKLGPFVVAKILLSYAGAKAARHEVESAADWVSANFGRELHERFFRVYNEKIWGIPSEQIAPDWAGQRIKASLVSMVYRSLVRDPQFIIKTFNFPRGGSESIIRAQQSRLEAGGKTKFRLNCAPARIEQVNGGFRVWFEENSEPEEFSDVIATIHFSDLASILHYPGKDEARIDEAISKLLYRNLLLVNLIFRSEDVNNMREHWIDIHDPRVQALRVTNFANYRPPGEIAEAPLAIEYNCWEDGPLWRQSDEDAVLMARRDLTVMGLAKAAPRASSVLREARAYPVYARGYREILAELFAEFGKVSGLVLAGRNAMFKWNNMHHSVKTGLLAARNVMGAQHDLAAVRGNVTIGKDSD